MKTKFYEINEEIITLDVHDIDGYEYWILKPLIYVIETGTKFPHYVKLIHEGNESHPVLIPVITPYKFKRVYSIPKLIEMEMDTRFQLMMVDDHLIHALNLVNARQSNGQ